MQKSFKSQLHMSKPGSYLHPSPHVNACLTAHLHGGQVDSGSGWCFCWLRCGSGRGCGCGRGFGLLGGSLRVLLGCHFSCLSTCDNTRSEAQSGGDSEQEITVWAYIYEAIFPLDPRQRRARVWIGSRVGGVCVYGGVLSKHGLRIIEAEGVYLCHISIIINENSVGRVEGYTGSPKRLHFYARRCALWLYNLGALWMSSVHLRVVHHVVQQFCCLFAKSCESQ